MASHAVTLALHHVVLGVIVGVCALTSPPALAQGVLPQVYAALPAHALESRLLALTNEARRASGQIPLAYSETLALAARHHAAEMDARDYVSHLSPIAANATVRDRTANAGGSMVRVGENIAYQGRMTLDLAERTVHGWLESPGHRQNMLAPGHTHVGFGVHERPGGPVIVVQVLADDPNPLRFAHASTATSASLRLRFEVVSDSSGFVTLMGGSRATARVQVAAGATTAIELQGISATEPTHIQLGWARDGSSGAIGQASGWFHPATRLITPDYESAHASSRILRYAVVGDEVRDVVVQLAFERGAGGLEFLVDGRRVQPEIVGTNARFLVPGGAGPTSVAVGVPQPDGRIAIIHQLAIERRSGQLVVLPGRP